MGALYSAYAPPTVAVTDDLGQQGIQNPFTQQTFQSHPLGFSCVYRGTTYYYCQAGGSAIAIGLGCTSAAPIANHTNIAASVAVAIGGNIVTPTAGATATTADQYADGWLHVNDADGEGQTRRIASNTAADASGTPAFTLKDALTIALTTSSEVSVVPHPYKSVIVAATTATADVVGVTVCPLTATYYGWLASYGPASVLVDGSDTVVIGVPVSIPAATAANAGACGVSAVTEPDVGTVMQVNAADEYALINLRIRAYSHVGI